jgi:hypothetical protein
MPDILTVGDLIAELSKHPADAQLRLNHADEDGPELYCAAQVYFHSDERAVCIETGDTPEQKLWQQAQREKYAKLLMPGIPDLAPARTFTRCNPNDPAAEQHRVNGNLAWVRPKS